MTSPRTPSPTRPALPARSYPASAYPVAQRLLRPTRRRPAAVPAGRLPERAAVAGPHLAFLAHHLTPRDRWLARVVGEHRVFTSTQLTQLAFSSARTANQRLLQLYQWRVLDRFQPLLAVGSAPMHYVLDVAGAAVLTAEDGLDPAATGYRHDRALAVGHSLRLSHTLGVNGLYAALVAVARHTTHGPGGAVDGRGDRAVTAWWPETRCARLWGDLARPDAYVRWHEDGTEIDFFLEYDTGTEPLARVAGKLHDYARLAAATGIATPVLFWFPTPAREAAARAALAATLTTLDQPAAVPLATTTAADPSTEHVHAAEHPPAPDSPAAARWLPLTPDRRAQHRVRLARLTWPQTTGTFVPAGASPPPLSGDREDDPGTVSVHGLAGWAEPEPMPPAGQSACTARPTNSDRVVADPRRRR